MQTVFFQVKLKSKQKTAPTFFRV